MKSLTNYISESIDEKYYHFTNVENIINMLKDGYFVTSIDDGYNPNGYSNYISLSRTLSFLHGYPKALINQKNIARITIDKQKLKSKFKIVPIDTLKSKRSEPKYLWGKYKDQTNVENEDRVLLNTNKLPVKDLYIDFILIKDAEMQNDKKKQFEELCSKYKIKFNYI